MHTLPINRIHTDLALSLLLTCSSLYPMEEDGFNLASYVPTSIKQSIARILSLDRKLYNAVHDSSDISWVKTYIAWGADPAKNSSLLQNAKNSDVFKLLLSHGARDSHFGFALGRILEKKDSELLKAYCACHDMSGYILGLHNAFTEDGWPEGARIMLFNGLDITTCDPEVGNIFHHISSAREAEFFVTEPQLKLYQAVTNGHIKRMIALRLCLIRLGVVKDIRNVLCKLLDYAIPQEVILQHVAHVGKALQQGKTTESYMGKHYYNFSFTPYQLELGLATGTPELIKILGMDATQLKTEFEPAITKEYVQLLHEHFTNKN